MEEMKSFTVFGTPTKVYLDGKDITTEVVADFDGITTWLGRLVMAYRDKRVTAYSVARIGGMVKLYVRSVY